MIAHSLLSLASAGASIGRLAFEAARLCHVRHAAHARACIECAIVAQQASREVDGAAHLPALAIACERIAVASLAKGALTE